MPPPYCYDYPRPAVTVDLVAFTLIEGSLRVLLIRRDRPPFAGRWAFPGGFMEIEEPIEDAARRELREETGFDLSAPISFLGVFGAPGRDPRGRTISMVYAVTVPAPIAKVRGGDDASEARWIDPKEARDLAFDHDEILSRGLEWLQQALEVGPMVVPMLPQPFEASDVRRLFKTLGQSPSRASAWIKRLDKGGTISPVANQEGFFRQVQE
ncbi:NUDIX domain-containing protein [Singulisphaera sp. PoT]|uniref:NUDIX domain-containing protein n=1 Tax=Singulisphaera sp. PoT TaxID=3411797 RepID=UPI003BF58A14